jgi:hypothetical protein
MLIHLSLLLINRPYMKTSPESWGLSPETFDRLTFPNSEIRDPDSSCKRHRTQGTFLT